MIRVKGTNQQGGGEGGTAPVKECEKCHLILHTAITVCPDCGYEFPKPEVKHQRTASSEGVISGEGGEGGETTDTTYTVLDIDYSVHRKTGALPGDPPTVRIDYDIRRDRGYDNSQSEWVCPEHSGWARKKFEQWWQKRSNAPPPDTAQEVVEIARSGGILPTVEITVRKTAGEKFDQIVGHQLGIMSDDHAQYRESAPGFHRSCGECSHFVYGYCSVKSDYPVTPTTKSCSDYLDLDDEVPF
jgi:DNA repair protein RadD